VVGPAYGVAPTRGDLADKGRSISFGYAQDRAAPLPVSEVWDLLHENQVPHPRVFAYRCDSMALAPVNGIKISFQTRSGVIGRKAQRTPPPNPVIFFRIKILYDSTT
jgi:hypothetical protein